MAYGGMGGGRSMKRSRVKRMGRGDCVRSGTVPVKRIRRDYTLFCPARDGSVIHLTKNARRYIVLYTGAGGTREYEKLLSTVRARRRCGKRRLGGRDG